MLQYFPKRSFRSLFQKNSSPSLAYVCNVGPEASHMPRSMHEHPHLAEILLLYGGAGIYMIDGRRYTAQKGDLILYNSHVVHDEHGGSGSGLGIYCIAVSGLCVDGLPQGHILPASLSPIQSTGDDFDEFMALFGAIEKEAPTHPETAHYLTLSLLTKISAHLAEHGKKEEAAVPSTVRAARAYIDQNYKDAICLEDIARATHTNPYYLAHLFKEEVGLPPMKYVALRRIGEAQNLLINTEMTVTQIAAQVGYNNSNYFQSVFKRAMGITPREYRVRWVR